ncbi:MULTISPECIES: Fe(3+)-hydroxamate ABC transporter permease FhuB [unclassified Aureimonas]|uniref:Fe(3+)-hydroxamate ABC transporter permease FhuB n=1 Tax=unclassified Aureimonas TaxID=2615206 RepID=UPI0006FF0AA6|nr:MULTISPECIES: Fe(3+)-hydroxamate ABC transporter permease FhuB [unclassified Aureimonas]KQT61890.1 iron ABC transporter [Aureimonas sp. Leaf460]KQT61900.1 iron ABC transporter [Aureimonas sp. Leaf427]
MRGPALLAFCFALPTLVLTILLIGPALAVVWRESAVAYAPGRMVLLYALLPRLVMAVLCGTALAASGALLQQALRNPLASPTTLGIDAGARLALALATLFAPALLGWGRDLVALAGSSLAAALVFALARRQDFAPVPLVLSGLLVGLYCGALASILTLIDSRWLVSLFIWGSGSLSQQSWTPSLDLALRLGLAAPFALLLLRPLSLLELGDDAARGLGLPVARLRLEAVALAVALSAFTVSAVGVIGFVGLVAPIMARLAGARDFRARLLWSSVIGALLLLLTDLLVQFAAGASSDLVPTGAVTAILGSPILLWLLPRLQGAMRPPSARGSHGALARRPGRSGLWLAATGLGTALLIAAALFLGRAPEGEWHWLGRSDMTTVLPWRWPRVLAVVSAGALLASAGFSLQRLTRNEMASPEILGISAGSTFAVAIALFGFGTLSPSGALMAAFAGALATLFLILALGRRSGYAPERMLLAGIAISALLDAVIGVVTAAGDPRAVQLLSWMAGATSTVEPFGAVMAAGAAALVLVLAVLAGRPLELLSLGPATAASLGLGVRTARLLLLALAALATAAATPVVGPLTFVGLIAPHLVRLAGVRAVVPALLLSAVAGASILVAADWVARVATFPFQLPTGLVASLVGAPVLFWLLQRRVS